MDGEEMRKRWNGLSEEIISRMAEWPKIEARLVHQARQRRTCLHPARTAITQTRPSRLAPNLDPKFLQALSTKIEQQNLPKKQSNKP